MFFLDRRQCRSILRLDGMCLTYDVADAFSGNDDCPRIVSVQIITGYYPDSADLDRHPGSRGRNHVTAPLRRLAGAPSDEVVLAQFGEVAQPPVGE